MVVGSGKWGLGAGVVDDGAAGGRDNIQRPELFGIRKIKITNSKNPTVKSRPTLNQHPQQLIRLRRAYSITENMCMRLN